MIWTDLSAMIYMVPLIITALVVLFIANFFGLASLGNIHCPTCGRKFNDVFDLRRHIKSGEAKEEVKLPKAA